MARWVAGLPMYNATPRHAALWRAFLRDTLDALARRGGPGNVALLDEPFGDLMPLWRRPDLLLSQTCGYPYRMLGLADTVRLIATPVFDVEGCTGARYCSLLAVSACAHARGATTIAECRGLRAACNGNDSHSGMNALRHAVAPHARQGRFFASVALTGSHLATLRALAADAVDVAAIDCITLAYVRDEWPESLRDIRIIGATAAAPGLPFVASRTLGDAHIAALREALDAALAADGQRARALRLRGFEQIEPDAYAEIERLAREAVALGYPALG